MLLTSAAQHECSRVALLLFIKSLPKQAVSVYRNTMLVYMDSYYYTETRQQWLTLKEIIRSILIAAHLCPFFVLLKDLRHQFI